MAIFAMTILQFVFMLIESWHLIRNIVNVRINILEMLRTMGNLVGMLQVSLINYSFNINFLYRDLLMFQNIVLPLIATEDLPPQNQKYNLPQDSVIIIMPEE